MKNIFRLLVCRSEIVILFGGSKNEAPKPVVRPVGTARVSDPPPDLMGRLFPGCAESVLADGTFLTMILLPMLYAIFYKNSQFRKIN
jgi:hypothetical protein